MFKLYSKGCEYALRALAYAPVAGEGNRFQARDACERAGIPESFTRKVFQSLVQAGFLRAHRGPGGGYSLTRSPTEITVLDVIRAVDGQDAFARCVMGLPECGSTHPCPLHSVWMEAKDRLLAHLGHSTLQELTESAALKTPPKPRR